MLICSPSCKVKNSPRRLQLEGSQYFYDNVGSEDKTLNFTKGVITIC